MVIETIAEREKTSQAVLDTLGTLSTSSAYADEVAKALAGSGSEIEFDRVLWTIWRLIDENRLFLDPSGRLVVGPASHVE